MKNQWFIIILLSAVMSVGAGCAAVLIGGAAAAGAVGGYAYVNGESKATVSASLDRSWEAAEGAMKDLEYPVISRSKDALQGILTARNASDTKITVRLKKLSETATEIRVRVGTFGDESLSRLIQEKINKRLTG